MKTYRIEFIGREAGAIGNTSAWTKEVEAASIDDARLKLYDTHEHIFITKIEIVD